MDIYITAQEVQISNCLFHNGSIYSNPALRNLYSSLWLWRSETYNTKHIKWFPFILRSFCYNATAKITSAHRLPCQPVYSNDSCYKSLSIHTLSNSPSITPVSFLSYNSGDTKDLLCPAIRILRIYNYFHRCQLLWCWCGILSTWISLKLSKVTAIIINYVSYSKWKVHEWIIL